MAGRIAAIVVITVLVVSGCTRNSPSQASASPSGTVKWTDCGSGVQGGAVQVALDYSRPGGTTIGIALDRKPATALANRTGSVLINPGGPRDSGLTFLRDDVSALKTLNKRFDLI